MGIFSGLLSIAGSIGRGIGNALGAAASGIASFAKIALSTFGRLIGSNAGGFLKLVTKLAAGPLGPVLGPIVGQLIFKVAVKAVMALAKGMGIIEEKDKAEEIGYRVEEAERHSDWKPREDFGTFKEYYEYLKQQIPDEEIDRDNLSKEKLKYEAMGVGAMMGALGEASGMELSPEFFFEVGRSRMEQYEMQVFIDAFKQLGFNTAPLSQYLQNKLSYNERTLITETVVQLMKAYYVKIGQPKNEIALYQRLDEMRAASQSDEFLAEKMYNKELKQIEQTKELPEEYK